MNLTFVTRCVEASCGEDINEMTDIPLQKQISTRYFIETLARDSGIDQQVLNMLGYDSKKDFAKDWHMKAAKSFYQGIPCYYVDHSRIEHIFVETSDRSKILSDEEAKARQMQISVLSDDFDEMLAERAPQGDKAYFELAREFATLNAETLANYRIPMSAFAQHHCEHRKAFAAYDRKHFGAEVGVVEHSMKPWDLP
jgi:hypothetical protein